MTKQELYQTHHQELYFFLLKKMKDSHEARNIFQSTFLKAYENYHQIKDFTKCRSWLFQIARNEMIDFYKKESRFAAQLPDKEITLPHEETVPLFSDQFCCFDSFIEELPAIYRDPMKLVYIEGKKQAEVAVILQLELPTVKMRIKRAKDMLMKRFNECCRFQIDKNGKLSGEQDCAKCNKVL